MERAKKLDWLAWCQFTVTGWGFVCSVLNSRLFWHCTSAAQTLPATLFVHLMIPGHLMIGGKPQAYACIYLSSYEFFQEWNISFLKWLHELRQKRVILVVNEFACI